MGRLSNVQSQFWNEYWPSSGYPKPCGEPEADMVARTAEAEVVQVCITKKVHTSTHEEGMQDHTQGPTCGEDRKAPELCWSVAARDSG